MSRELTHFSYMVLGLVGREGLSPYDLQQMVRRGRIYDWVGESQYYVEPKRLARLGYLDARKEPGKTRERTVYTLTEQGLEALREWAPTPVRYPRMEHEALTRLLVADLVGAEVTRETFGTLRDELADLRARLDESVATAEQLPHRRDQLLLAIDFLRRLLDLHDDLVDDCLLYTSPSPRDS